MTDLDILLGNNAEPAPTFLPFSQWSADKEAEDPVKLKIDYSDYIRESYLNQGKKIDMGTEKEIQQGLYDSLVGVGKLKEGDYDTFESLIAPPDVSFDEKFNLVKTTLGYDDADQEPLNQFVAMDKAIKSMDPTMVTDETKERFNQLRLGAEEVVNKRFNDVKIQAVRNKELPFAAIINDKNEREIIAGDLAAELDLPTALKRSKMGGVSLSDAVFAQDQLAIPEGFSVPRYKAQRYAEAANVITELAKSNDTIKEIIDGRSTNLAQKEYDTNDVAKQTLNAVGGALTTLAGKTIGLFSEGIAKQTDDAYNAASKRRIWSRTDEDEVAAGVSKILAETKAIPNAETFSVEEIKSALTQIALQDANNKGKFELYTDEGSYGKNIRTYGFGAPVIHQAAIANEDIFNKTLEARSDLTPENKESLKQMRIASLNETFYDTSALLARSNVADDWNEALVSGRQQGKQNHEILSDFLKDEKNYSEFSERARGVGRSLVDAITNPFIGVLAAGGATWAQESLVADAQANADRRAVANLFGVKMGFGQDLTEAIAPMVADVAATTVLALATAPAAGTGGAAYMAARQGTRLTAKGLLKSLTSSAFKVAAGETAEQAAKRLVTSGLVKESLKDISGKGSMAAIKGYNNLVAQRIGTAAASFIPAATRSGAATYGSVSLALSQNTDLNLTKEEIHDRALGAAFSAGAITGIITSAFGAFGKAGVEDAMLRGLTFKQAKSLLGSLANTKNLSDDVFKAAVKTQLAASIKKFQQGAIRGVVKNMKDEAEEEGLDQLLNSFVEDAATNQNTPMLERLQGALYASALGGVLGGGVPVISNIGNRIRPNVQQQIAEANMVQQDFIDGVTKRLEQSGSPLTSKLVRQILTSRVRSRQTPPTPAAGNTAGVSPTQPNAPVTPAPVTATATDTTTPVVSATGQMEFPFTGDLGSAPAASTAPAAPAPATADTTATAVQLELPFTDNAQPPAAVPVEAQQLELPLGDVAPAAVTISPEAQAAIDERQQQIAALTQPVAGERKGRRGRKNKAQKQAEQLQLEVDHIQQTGSTEIPADLAANKKKASTPTPAITINPSYSTAAMSPAEYVASFKKEAPTKAAGLTDEQIAKNQANAIYAAITASMAGQAYPQPLNALAVESFKFKLPQGYVKQGDLYIFNNSDQRTATGVEADNTAQGQWQVGSRVAFASPRGYTLTGVVKELRSAEQSFEGYPEAVIEWDESNLTNTQISAMERKSLKDRFSSAKKRGERVSDSVAQSQLTALAPTAETNPASVDAPDILSAEELQSRIDATPQEEADKIIQDTVAQLEGTESANTAFVDADVINTSFEQTPVQIAIAVPAQLQQAAAAAGIDPQQSIANQASHIALFDPDNNAPELPSRKKKRKPYAPVKTRAKKPAAPTVDADIAFDITPFQEADQPTDAEQAEAAAVVDLAKRRGFPVRFGRALRYGVFNGKNAPNKSDFLANVVYTVFPVLEIDPIEIAETVSSSRRRTYYDPAQNKVVKGTMKFPLDENGRGIFNNDPMLVAEMLSHGIPVAMPSDVVGLNPAFVTKNGYVVDVRMPSADGKGVESAVTLLNKTTTMETDNSLFFSYSNLPFYPVGVESKVLPAGVSIINPTTGNTRGVTNTETTFGKLQENLFSLLRNGDAMDAILNSLGRVQLESDFRDNAIQSGATEYLLLGHLFELRHALLTSKSGLTIPSPTGVMLNPSKKKAAIKELSSRLKGNPDLAAMAAMFSPLLKSKRAASPTHTEVVTQFIEDLVLNNKDFDGNVMPPFQSVLGRTRSRYLEQQITRGIHARNQAMVSLDELGENAFGVIDGEQLSNSATPLGGIDPAAPLEEQLIYDTAKSAVTDAIDAIENDSELRDALNDLAFQSVYQNPDGHMVKHVQNMNAADLMARIGQWMAIGNHANRPDVLEFVSALRSGGFESGIDLRNALRISALGARFEGNPVENAELVSEVQRQLSDSLGSPVTEARAKNFIKAMDGAVRRRLSRAVVDSASKRASRDQNADDIARLGLISGDPESVIAALTQIAKSSTNPSHKLVAELLLEDPAFIRKVGFSFGASQADIAGEYVRGIDGTHSVFLNTERGNGLGLENVLLEEYVHAFMSDTLTKSPDLLTTQQREARKRLEGLYQLASAAYQQQKSANGADGYNASLESGLENMDEFVANFLLDPEFQKFIKTLPAPQGQRGFFKRIIDAMVSMFRKITGKENAAYAKALKDIVDLSKTTIRATAVPFKLQVASNATTAANIVASATNIPRVLATSVAPAAIETPVAQAQETPVETTIEEVSNQEQTRINDNLDAVSAEASATLPTQVGAEFTQLMEFLKSRIPYGVGVTVDLNLDSAAAADANGNIIINPAILMDVVSQLDPTAQRGLIETIINEELGHVSSFNSLTQNEIDSIAESLTDEDFAEIARAYFANNPTRAEEAIANLQSDNPTTVARQKEILVEEKLRMRMQEVTRGYTTEDDNAFWSSKPSLLAILRRYIGGVLNRFANTRRLRGSSGVMDAAVFSMIQEMEAMHVGFARTNVTQALDPDAPAAAIDAYNRILNRDILAEIEEYEDDHHEVSRLATSLLPIDAFQSLLTRGGFKVVNGNTLVEDTSPPKTQTKFKKTRQTVQVQSTRLRGWETPQEGVEEQDNTSRLTMPITLQDLSKFVDATDFRSFPRATEDFVVNEDGLYTLPVLYVRYNEDTQQFAVNLNQELSQQAFAQLTAINSLVDIVDLLNENQTAGNTTIPLQVALQLDGLSADAMMEAEVLLFGGMTEDEIPTLVLETSDSTEATILPFAPDMQRITPDSADIVGQLNERIQNSKETFEDEPNVEDIKFEGVNIEAFEKAASSLSDETFTFRVIKIPSRVKKQLKYVLRVYNTNADNKYDADTEVSFIDFAIINQTELHVGYMGRSQGTTAEVGASTSFAENLIRTLIMNNDQINFKKITTTAGGNGDYHLKHTAGRRFIIDYPINEDPAFSQVKSMESILPPAPANAMNGYQTWPTYGFQLDESSAKSFATLFGNPQKRTAFKELKKKQVATFIRNISKQIAQQLQFDSTQQAAHELNTEAYIEKASTTIDAEVEEFVANCTTPDGKIDLYYGLHTNPTVSARSRTKSLLRSYGQQRDVEFDLADRSPMMKGYVSRVLRFVVQKNNMNVETLDNITNRYQKEVSQASPEEVQDIKDKYNDEAKSAGMKDPIYTSVGAKIRSGSTLGSIDFSPVVQLLEMPMFEYGTYKAPKGWLNMFRGDLSKPMKRLIEQRDEFKRASSQLVVSYKEKMDTLIVKAYGSANNADWDLIAKAQGYISGNILSDAAVQVFDDTLAKELTAIAANTTLNAAQKKAERAAARQRRDDAITLAEDNAIKQITIERDAALTKLASASSELAAHIVSMRRDLIQPIQQKLIAAGIDPDIGVKIDKTGGIYITRAYAMFNDPTYAERVRVDPKYAAVRDAAMKFFAKQLYDTTFMEGKNSGLADADAMKLAADTVQKANQKAPAGSSYGAQAMEAFLSKYDGRSSPNPQNTKGLRVLENNMKNRKDLPKELRDLLGEYGAETGTDLIVRTFSTVAMVAAQQTFLNNLSKMGIQEGFFVDAKTYAANPAAYPDYVQVRNGGSSKNDPLKHMYAPKELVDTLGAALNVNFATNQSNTAEKAVSDLALVARNLTGKAMVAKTLGSVGFYLRNMLGNMLFFAPSQGFFRVDKIAKTTATFAFGRLKDPNQINAYLAELTGLGVIGDEIQASIIRDLLNGKTNRDGLLAKLDEYTQELAVVGKARKGMEWLQQKATDLSGAIDAAYKMEYYEFELNNLRQAKNAEPTSTVGRLSEYDLKRMAADKVKMTSQSMSQAPPLAQALTNSGFGMMFAPFIRFKMEVPRIVINTYKLGIAEARSDNSVIRSRGRKRLVAMSTMLAVVSSAVPAVLAALTGIGDEEDEALRKSMPEYLRGHSFWIRRREDGTLESLDLTYLNPFSLMVDPIMRAMPKLLQGDVSGTVSTMLKGFIYDSYLDDQILMGSVSEAMKNNNATTNQPIWIEGVDEPHVALGKALEYVFSTAYSPRIVKDAVDAYEAVGGDYTGFSNSPIGQLLDGAYPIKRHEIDLEKQHRRFLFEHKAKMEAVNKKKYAVYSKEAMSADEIATIYDEELQGRRKLNQELMGVLRGFEGLGLNARDQYKTMTSIGIGKERARLIFHGVMDRPDINKEFAEGLLRRDHADRLRQLYETRNRYNRYIFIEDPK